MSIIQPGAPGTPAPATGPTGADLARLALTHMGVPYDAGADRFGPNFFDCSGMIHADLTQLGVNDSGAGGYTSLTYQDWITRSGGTSTLDRAKQEAGLIVCLGHSEGPSGHIGLTLGGGQVIETPSASVHGVGVDSFDYNAWDFAGLVPGLNYDGTVVASAGGTGATTTGLFGGGSSNPLGDLASCLPTSCLLLALCGAGVFELLRVVHLA